MTKSRSFWSAWGNSEYKRIFELSAGIYGFPYYRKGMDKTRKAASEQSDAAVLGMFVRFLINQKIYKISKPWPFLQSRYIS